MAFNNETYFSSAATRSFRLTDKLTQYPINAWVSVGRLGVDRETAAGAGTVNAGLVVGGNNVSNTQLTSTEILTGNSWFTSSGTIATATKYIKGFGIVSAAVSSGGFPSSVTSAAQKFNGISWSSTGSMTSARYSHLNIGSSSAGLAAGGDSTGTPTWLNSTDKFNGTTWSSSGTLITARYHAQGAGTQNSSFLSGGIASGFTLLKSSEYFNGSTWSSLTSGLVERYRGGSFGTTSNAVCSGGLITTGSLNSASCELFNGSVFLSSPVSMLSTFSLHSADGSGNSGFAAAGNAGTAIAGTTPQIWLNNPALALATLFKGDADQFQVGGDIVATSAGYYLLDENFDGNSSVGGTEFTDLIILGKHNDPGQGSWASSGSLNIARRFAAGSGTQNAGLTINGITTSSPLSSSEIYNGTTWANDSSTTNATRAEFGAFGTRNASVACGGATPSLVSTAEKYNGTAWSNTGSLPSGVRGSTAGCGVFNAGLQAGGTDGVSQQTSAAKFNGSTWANTGAMNTARGNNIMAGSQNNGLTIGGSASGATQTGVEKFNGSIWSTTTSLSLALFCSGAAGTGSNAMRIGGDNNTAGTTPVSTTEVFNSLVWSVAASLPAARNGHPSSAGSVGASFSAGGSNGTVAQTSGAKYTVILPDAAFGGQGAWNISGTYPVTNIENGFLAGTQTAAVMGGGFSNASSATALAHLYNGISWTATGSFNIGARAYGVGAGIQSAALAIAGSSNGTAAGSVSSVMSFNGSTWSTATGSLNTARENFGGCGLAAAALAFGGVNTSNALITNNTETYNGTAWSVSGALNTNRSDLGGCGTQGSAISIGGRISGTASSVVENFNGSTWSTNSASIPFRAPYSSGTAGTSTGCFTITRDTASFNLQAKFNGSYWASMSASSAVNHLNSNAAGSTTAGMVVGGQSTSVTENYINTATSPSYLAQYVLS